jgi:hypothetical protein
MRVRDPKELERTTLPIHNNVLRASDLFFITNNDSSYLIHSGIRKVVVPHFTLIQAAIGGREPPFSGHIPGLSKSLLIKVNSRVRLMKDALKQIQGVRIKGMVFVTCIVLPQTNISHMLSVMNVELRVNGFPSGGENRASLMDEFTM